MRGWGFVTCSRVPLIQCNTQVFFFFYQFSKYLQKFSISPGFQDDLFQYIDWGFFCYSLDFWEIKLRLSLLQKCKSEHFSVAVSTMGQESIIGKMVISKRETLALTKKLRSREAKQAKKWMAIIHSSGNSKALHRICSVPDNGLPSLHWKGLCWKQNVSHTLHKRFRD